MDDALVVRRPERLGDLARQRQRFLERQSALRDSIGKGRPGHELHDDRPRRLPGLNAIDMSDRRMADRREEARFAIEPHEAIRIGGHRIRQHLERNLAPEARVTGPIDLAHPACADERDDFIRAQACASWKRHRESTGF